MNNDSIYSKLTPSAKEALKDLSEEYTSSLLERAYRLADERETSDKEISLRDIIEAQKGAKKTIDFDRYYYKKKRWTLLLSLSGAVYASLGILIYLFQNKKFSIENDIGLIIAILGIFISLISFFIGQYSTKSFVPIFRTKDYLKDDYIDNIIVNRWQLIEDLARKSMSIDDENQLKSYSVSFLIRYLSHKIAKNEEEFLKIRNLLQVRNKIIHESYHMHESEGYELLNFSAELIKRLENKQADSKKSPEKLVIINAIYGTANKFFDATKELNQLITNNRLEFVLNNEIVGDPDPGIIKKLQIKYSIGDKIKSETYEEGAKVIIQ